MNHPFETPAIEHVRPFLSTEDLEAAVLPADYRGPARDVRSIMGLDLSLTNTGMVIDRGGVTTLHRIRTKPEEFATGPAVKGKASTTWMDRQRRMAHIRQQIINWASAGLLVFVEAPSYGSAGSGTFDRSGLWWMVYDALVRAGARVVPVSPSQRMLYATGKGGGKDAGKDAVIAAVTRRYPWLDVTDNNVADALVLAAMAMRAAGDPLEEPGTIPAANLKALEKLEEI